MLLGVSEEYYSTAKDFQYMAQDREVEILPPYGASSAV
jgi:hypothetical protein